MIDKNRIIESIQEKIALSNLKKDLIENKDSKKYTDKKIYKIFDMKKKILAFTCCGIILIGGIAYAYSCHFKLSNNFFKTTDSNYLDETLENLNIVEGENKIIEDRLAYLNGYLIVGLFKQDIGKNSNYTYAHNGIDIAVPIGSKILAVADGVIKETNFNSEYGNYIIVKNDEEYETLYAHLDKINVKEGESISQNQEIATSGITGNVVAPILHLELHHNGEPVNPLDYIDKIYTNKK